MPAAASAAGNAGYTTFDETIGGCIHGSAVNCNTYDSKDSVYMNGGPSGGSGLADGEYFFAVLNPGAQNTFLSGVGLLSSDDVADRTFSETSGEVDACPAGHASGSQGGRLICGLAPFGDTSNTGGVYIMAICKAGATSPKDCKFDAFKVDPGDECEGECVQPADDLIVTKTAEPAVTRQYSWTIDKSVDNTQLNKLNGTATFNYTVALTRSGPAEVDWVVSGSITVLNPNGFAVNNVDVTDDINDLNDADDCVVTDGAGQTIGANDAGVYSYTCSYSAAPDPRSQTNTATAQWPTQGTLTGNSATFDVPFSFDDAIPTDLDACADVSDTYAGSLGQACDSGSPTYARTVNVPANGCATYDNTASFVTVDTGATGSDSQTVTVCRVPPVTGALTIGYWQNKNGQAQITNGASTSGVCNSGTYLRTFAPFQDLSATANCRTVASYVAGVIKVATCTTTTKTCNSMLKAQMLATALDVFFSTTGLGSVKIDLTQVCANPLACTSYVDTRSAFGGATALTVSQMLTYAGSQSNVGGSTWYGQVKATQVLAKDAFDAINNQVAYQAP